MKVLLVNPPYTEKKGNIWREVASCQPPLGIASLAAYLESKEIAVEVMDAEALQMSVNDIEKALNKKEYSWLGISAVTTVIDSALAIAAVSKKVKPHAKVVLGGVHPTVMSDRVLACSCVDYAVRGEGEITLFELVSGSEPHGIKSLSFREGGKNVHNPARDFIEDLDSLPLPAYHLLPMDRYYPARGSYKRLPAISVMASRGCPGQCTFCYTGSQGQKIRMLSAGRLIELIKMLKKNYGIREINFYDDTFTVLRKNLVEFCRRIIKEKIDITWSCFARVDFISEETLALMKKSGCHQICYGLESGDEKVLKSIGKRFSLARAEKAIKLTKKSGIEARAAFMFGNPGDTPVTLKKTLDFALKTDPDIAVFNITTPYPGTEMFDWARRCGRLLTEDWSKYDVATPVMSIPGISGAELMDFYRYAYRKFYIRPSYILRRAMRLRKFSVLKDNIFTFFRLLSGL